MSKGELKDRDEKLHALGVDPSRIVDERDAEHMLNSALDQQAVVCTLTDYRYPDTLAPGARAPDLRLHPLAGAGSIRLADLGGNRPVVLVFGSYT